MFPQQRTSPTEDIIGNILLSITVICVAIGLFVISLFIADALVNMCTGGWEGLSILRFGAIYQELIITYSLLIAGLILGLLIRGRLALLVLVTAMALSVLHFAFWKDLGFGSTKHYVIAFFVTWMIVCLGAFLARRPKYNTTIQASLQNRKASSGIRALEISIALMGTIGACLIGAALGSYEPLEKLSVVCSSAAFLSFTILFVVLLRMRRL